MRHAFYRMSWRHLELTSSLYNNAYCGRLTCQNVVTRKQICANCSMPDSRWNFTCRLTVEQDVVKLFSQDCYEVDRLLQSMENTEGVWEIIRPRIISMYRSVENWGETVGLLYSLFVSFSHYFSGSCSLKWSSNEWFLKILLFFPISEEGAVRNVVSLRASKAIILRTGPLLKSPLARPSQALTNLITSWRSRTTSVVNIWTCWSFGTRQFDVLEPYNGFRIPRGFQGLDQGPP